MNAVLVTWGQGGESMLLVAMLVAAVSVFVERWLWFRRTAFDPEELFALLDERVRMRDVAGAITRCTLVARAPLVRVVLTGLTHLHRDDAVVRSMVASAVLAEGPRAERRVAWLAALAQIGALVGFFGTLTGLFVSGHGWSCGPNVGPTIDPARIAELLVCTLGETMRCTQLGLLVALVAGAGYALFRARAQARARELDAAAAWVVALADTRRAVEEPAVAYR